MEPRAVGTHHSRQWNALKEASFLRGARLECKDLPNDGEMPDMSEDVQVGLTCMVTDDPELAYVFLAVSQLADIQNRVLLKAVQEAGHAGLSALRFFRRSDLIAQRVLMVTPTTQGRLLQLAVDQR